MYTQGSDVSDEDLKYQFLVFLLIDLFIHCICANCVMMSTNYYSYFEGKRSNYNRCIYCMYIYRYRSYIL